MGIIAREIINKARIISNRVNPDGCEETLINRYPPADTVYGNGI